MNKSQIALLFAHKGEAKAFFGQYTFKKIEKNHYQCEFFDLFIIGEKAKNINSFDLSAFSKIMLLGTSGSFNQKYPIGKTFSFKKAYRKAFESKEELYLITVDERMDKFSLIDLNLYKNALVDMESAVIYDICKIFNQDFLSIRVVSDYVLNDSEKNKTDNVIELAKSFSNQLLNEFIRITNE